MQEYTVKVYEGHTEWLKNGKLHREDGPAIEYSNGYKAWYKNGKSHREDGPAVEYADGAKFWYKNGKHHREDGPAVEYSDGSKFWYKNGKHHREDGPAVEYSDGEKEWYLNGAQLTEQEFNEKMNPIPKNSNIQLLLREECIVDSTEMVSSVMDLLGVTREELCKRLNWTDKFLSKQLSGPKDLALSIIQDMLGAMNYKIKIKAIPISKKDRKKMEAYINGYMYVKKESN